MEPANKYPFAGAFVMNDGHCLFSVWAPLAENVQLILEDDYREQAFPLDKDDSGYWRIILPDIPPGTRYRYSVDGMEALPDPASRRQPDGVHGASEVVDPHFTWTDNGWKGIPLRDMVIYELHTGCFTPEHSFEGIMKRLPYLSAIGVNTIELMPVAQFPGKRNWGYDGVFPFAVHNTYGTPAQLKTLVNAAHLHGIAVVLDVVYNHLGPEGNYLEQYGPYFTEKYKTPWGKALNFDDAWCDGVRSFYINNALMWLNEFRMDGLRIDAVHAIWDCGATHFMEELSGAVQQLESISGRKKVLIAEIDYNAPRYIKPTTEGGYGLSGQWTDEFHHALHALLTNETNGYYADFGNVAPFVKSLRESYVYTGEYSQVRNRKFGRSPEQLPYHQFVVFTQNHDQIGNRLKGERLSSLVSFDALKLAAAAMLLTAHTPMLFMGEEYGETNPFLFFTDHSDAELISKLRKGRKEEFKSFNWADEVPDPQSEAEFSKSTLSWNTDTEKAAILTRYYTHLIALRKQRAALRNTDRAATIVEEPAGKLIVFERKASGENLLVLLNFSDKPEVFHDKQYPSLKKIFDSSEAQWSLSSTDNKTSFIPPYTAVVYEIQPV